MFLLLKMLQGFFNRRERVHGIWLNTLCSFLKSLVHIDFLLLLKLSEVICTVSGLFSYVDGENCVRVCLRILFRSSTSHHRCCMSPRDHSVQFGHGFSSRGRRTASAPRLLWELHQATKQPSKHWLIGAWIHMVKWCEIRYNCSHTPPKIYLLQPCICDCIIYKPIW